MQQTLAVGFVDAVNSHDIDAVAALLSDDHVFIDARGNRTQGRDTVCEGWAVYFSWFPDYTIELTDVLESGNVVALFGFASGTYRDTGRRWEIPAAWKAVVDGDTLREWQVYADTAPQFESMG